MKKKTLIHIAMCAIVRAVSIRPIHRWKKQFSFIIGEYFDMKLLKFDHQTVRMSVRACEWVSTWFTTPAALYNNERMKRKKQKQKTKTKKTSKSQQSVKQHFRFGFVYFDKIGQSQSTATMSLRLWQVRMRVRALLCKRTYAFSVPKVVKVKEITMMSLLNDKCDK